MTPPDVAQLDETDDERLGAETFELTGQVSGAIPEGAVARGVLQTLHQGEIVEQVIAESAVDDGGSFLLEYQQPPGYPALTDATLHVRVDAPDETTIASSDSMAWPPGDGDVHLELESAHAPEDPSEYAVLETEIADRLESGVSALDGAEDVVVEEVSDWLGVDPERLRLFQLSRELEHETAIPAPAFYALGRSGASPELDDLIDMPIDELRATLEDAVDEGIVDAEALGDVEATVTRLAEQIIDRAMAEDREAVEPGIAEVLTAADVPRDVAAAVLRRYQSRIGDGKPFWESFGESPDAEALDEDTRQQVQLALEVGDVLGPDPSLLRTVHALRREGRWRTPDDLASLTFDDWCEVVAEADAEQASEDTPGEGAESGEAESDESFSEMVEARAEAILETLEETYPTAFIRRHPAVAERLSAGARQLLERAPRHDLLGDSIRAQVETEPGLVEGLDEGAAEAAIEEIEAIERVSRVTHRADEVAVLVESGMHSALDIAATPQRHFIELYSEALGGRAQAARVHAQAQQAAGSTKLLALRLMQALQRGPHVLVPPPPDIKGMPDARTLFRASGGFCECEHCESVYSPAAYYVDLLRYLNVSTPERLARLQGPSNTLPSKLLRFQPLDVLLGRRPDLADLPLTCENTNTALPYIDLVNELLEARVTGGSAAFDTGKTAADVLRAVPQNISRDAYVRLQQAVHPLSLPYHQPLALARAYLAHLGVTRLELLRALGRGDAAPAAATAEALGMSPDEYAPIVRMPAEPWTHFGFSTNEREGRPYVDVLTHVPTFLDSTGITFQNLIDLIAMRFLNGDNALHLQAASTDCDPDKVRIAGLDEGRLSGMLRLIRLQRRLGWTYAMLDRALISVGATDLDDAVLGKLAAIKELAARVDRPVVELLVLWAPLDAWGKDNQFDRIFASRAVMWRTQDERTFQLRADRAELAETGDSLDAVASALLAGFRITSEDLALVRALLTRRGAAPRLDFAGLSAMHRVVTLARALQLSLAGLDLLLRLVPPDADPFRPGDPAATLKFADIALQVQNSDFTPERLVYLFRHESDPRRDPAPLPAQVESVLNSIRLGLADAYAETSPPAQATGEILRQKLGLLFDAALLDPAMEALDPRSTQRPEVRRAFFDRHLARLFQDPAAAAARLLTPAPPNTSREEMESRWIANVNFVLEHLLPQLRVRQLRSTVVQTLSDTLGLSVRATAHLLDTVMRSSGKAEEPLLRDFLALLGTGLTGAYFATPDLTGEPALVRTDPEIAFSWGGAAPAPGVPGKQFSVRWTGRIVPRTKASHTFYVQTDGAVRLTVKTAAGDQVLIDQPTGSPSAIEHVSKPVDLDPRHFTEVTLEYRNLGGPATLSLQAGTGPQAKQPVATPNLFPANGLASFAPVAHSYRRLHKAALVLTGFGVTDSQLEWLTKPPAFLDLNALPMQPPSDADAVALFQRWRRLAGLYALRKRLPRANVDLFDVLNAQTLPAAIDRLVLATGWDRAIVEAFAGPDGLAFDAARGLSPAPDDAGELAVLRLARAVDIQKRVGVTPATLYAWANATPDADTAASIVQAVKARYDEARWLEVAKTLNDPLRGERRDALVAYLLPRMRELGVTTRNQLFEYFLIDVDMNPCMLTSRIRQATGAVQTFFQRCLMNLEAKVPPRIIAENDWKWLKNYRVWEANRKIFLYPENWIEPELRDDKSPLFQGLERTILQQEITNENVEAAFADYLEGLDEIARLDVRGVWFEPTERHRMVARPKPRLLRIAPNPWSDWDNGTYHIFARTFNAPYVWYYRRLENGRSWTPWEKIDADIDGDHLVPVVFQRRMHLFWALFREVSKPAPPMDRESKEPPPVVGKDWEIQLAYTVYDRGKWSRKRLSSAGVKDAGDFRSFQPQPEKKPPVLHMDGTQLLPTSAYTLRASQSTSGGLPQLHVHVYSRTVRSISRGHVTLAPTQVERVASFALDGCNGALVPQPLQSSRSPVHEGRAAQVKRIGPLRLRRQTQAGVAAVGYSGPSHSFQLTSGGRLHAPVGYHVDGMGFTAGGSGPLLALQPSAGRGVSVALQRSPGGPGGAFALPVMHSSAFDPQNLYPFFFRDRFRSYFARPIGQGWRPALFMRPPAIRRVAAPAPKVGRRRPTPIARPKPGAALRRGGRGRREDVELFEPIELAPAVELWPPEALDAWEDEQDEAWYPDDAAELKLPRLFKKKRKRAPARPQPRPQPARPAAPPARRRAVVAKPRPTPQVRRPTGYNDVRLQFTPFEHSGTCHFMSTLKARGVEGLLALTTTRPPRGADHALQPDGSWRRQKPSWFERHYGAGALIFTNNLPHLDVGFESEHPYGGYNWELFFHAPLQVAIRLAKDGRHEEAQRWFHFIFDPTTDSSVQSAKRYWRFAPFHENNEYDNARELLTVLSYKGQDPELQRRREQVRNQLSAWWEKPFSPHVIARLRIAAYQKAVVMKYIDNLIEWGDKLFRRDTMESIQEATQIYILAANILGPRPEKIPPIVSKETLTFQKMRHDLNLFSNFEVRLENLQVRRPFRIAAQPDVSGASAVLGMMTQYFCTPPNPQLDKYWDTVADRLFKIRNCMNIQGTVRQLALFDPPIDPGLLVRAAAAGVDLGSVIASLNAPPPHYRFRVLLARATRLAEEIRSFGAMTLQVLERRDAEGLAALRASGETVLLEAVRDIRKKQVRQVEEALAELNLEREHVELQMQHLTAQLAQLMNPQEQAQQKSMSAAQVVAGVAQGIDLVSKVLYAIPELQSGTAGGFSSPFITVQLGGQMLGDVSSAIASSFETVSGKHEQEAELAAAQAEYQRRREEWQHEYDLLGKEKAQIQKRIAEAQLKLEIASAEMRRQELEVENSRKIERYLRDKYTNQQLYGWMLGQLSGVYFQAYKVAFDAAQQAERAFRFERGDAKSSFIEFSYWDSLKKGLFAGERLLVDLRRLEAAHVEGDQRSLEVTRHISLKRDLPMSFIELVATGRCQFALTEAFFDGDFPGHYFRRIKTVAMTVTGAVASHSNVNCTLTLLENRIRTDGNASGSYAPSADAEDSRFLVNAAPVQVVATSRSEADHGLFQLRFDDERYLPFEGAGAISTWRIELHQADNGVDLSQLADVVMTVSYTARSGGAALEAAARAEREKGIARGGLKPEARHLISLRRDEPAAWAKLVEAPAGQEVTVPIPLTMERLSGRYRGLDVRIDRVTLIATPRAPQAAEALKVRLDPPKGSGTPIGGLAPAWPGSAVLRAAAEISGGPGEWKLIVSAAGAKVTDLVDDVVLVFDLRARKA